LKGRKKKSISKGVITIPSCGTRGGGGETLKGKYTKRNGPKDVGGEEIALGQVFLRQFSVARKKQVGWMVRLKGLFL